MSDNRCGPASTGFAVKSVFEGSHAQNCGWGPRRYPNLLDKDAVDAFIKCTYDKYFESNDDLVEWLRKFSENKEDSFVRGFLGRMLFSSEEALKKVNVFLIKH